MSEDEGLFMRQARLEREMADEEGRKPEGWIWTQDMDTPREIDFDAIPEEKEGEDETRGS